MGTPIMERTTKIPFEIWTETTLNHSLKRYMRTCEAELIYTDIWCPKKQRKGDKFLMKEIYRKYRDNKRLLKQMNRCRIAVQAITLADITESDGKKITVEVLIGHTPTHRGSRLDWPIMGRIKTKYWKEWKNCIK